MNRTRSIIPILLALSATHAQDVSPLRPLPFKSKERAIAGVFSLSPENITTEITGAYRYRDRIVVFGWSGHSNGIVTVIDAATGKEILELLVNERFRFIIPAGALIYAHWFVVGAYERDDSVWLLDLNHPVPRPKSNLGANVTDQAGVQIYPSATGPHLRHRLTEMLPADDGQTLYLVDRPVPAVRAQEVCLVAINIMNLNRVTDNHNCVDEKKLTGYSPGEIVATSLTFTPRGTLQYTVTAAGETGKTESFTVNPTTLTPSRAIPNSSSVEGSETSPPAAPRAMANGEAKPQRRRSNRSGRTRFRRTRKRSHRGQPANRRIGKSNECQRIRKLCGGARKIGGRPAWMVIQADNLERAPHEGSRRVRNPASRPLQETVTGRKQAMNGRATCSLVASAALCALASGALIATGQAGRSSSPPIRLLDISNKSGLRFQQSYGDRRMDDIVEGTGTDMCVVDYNNDGFLEVYFSNGNWTEGLSDDDSRDVRGMLENQLFRNDGDGTFTDVTAQVGLVPCLAPREWSCFVLL